MPLGAEHAHEDAALRRLADLSAFAQARSALARGRLRLWAPNAEVVLLDPPARELPGPDGACDRFVATAALARRWPALSGGCRQREVVTRWGVPSGVVVAVARVPEGGDG